MIRPSIRYYCPRSSDAGAFIPRPSHRDDLHGLRLVDGCGPDTSTGGAGGGMIYGGPYETDEPGWTQTRAGWWLHLGAAKPQHLACISLHPRVARWATVQGTRSDEYWRVPVLIAPVSWDEDGNPAMYGSALERAWQGEVDGWKDPADLVEVQDLLHRLAYGIALHGDPRRENEAMTNLTLRLLELGHRISEHELVKGGWLSERFMLRVLIAAADVPLVKSLATP